MHPTQLAETKSKFAAGLALAGVALLLAGCVTPIGADKTTPALAYRQIHDNPISQGELSRETRTALHRFQQLESFEKAPDAVLRFMQQKAIDTRERGLLFVLAELNYAAGERLRHSVQPWEPRDPRDYYLASSIYAWLFLLGEGKEPPPGLFDERFGTACELYNYALGWAFTERRSTNAIAIVEGGTRRVQAATVELEFKHDRFPWPLSNFDQFVVADHYLVRGLSVRNRQTGLGAPLIAVTKPHPVTKHPRTVPVTVFLRPEGGLAEIAQGRLRASLELYSAFDQSTVQVGDRTIPLETDTTVSTAYGLNQSFVWKLGMAQFLSHEEQIPSDVYLTQPYRAGRIPVVFVHGTFSSPVVGGDGQCAFVRPGPAAAISVLVLHL